MEDKEREKKRLVGIADQALILARREGDWLAWLCMKATDSPSVIVEVVEEFAPIL